MSSVDVVVPCYNYARFLDACVGSILAQQEVNVRVLIIDDTSSDDTPAVAERLARSDPRVQFWRHALNRGHIATYNEGLLEWASAEYSVLLSADDMIAPGALARATSIMDEHREVVMTYGMAVVIVDDDSPGTPLTTPSDEYQIVSGSDFVSHCFLQTYNPVPTPTAVVRTACQHLIGGYKREYPHTGDLEMWMRFATEGSVAVVRAVQGYYRWHTSNMSKQYYGQPVGDLRELQQVCREFIHKHGERFTMSARWPEALSRGIAHRAVASASRAFNYGAHAECAAQLAFAEEAWPRIRFEPPWWRLATKRLLGESLWLQLQPAANRLRGLPPDQGPGAPFWRGLSQGWWPG
jgi:hypothetical protein